MRIYNLNIPSKLSQFWTALECFRFSSRLNRSKYFFLTIFWYQILLLTFFLTNESLPILIVLSLLIVLNLIALKIRRLNDFNISGWWALFILISFFGFCMSLQASTIFYEKLGRLLGIILFSIVIFPGNKKENKYGSPPESTTVNYLYIMILPSLIGIGILFATAIRGSL